MIPRSVATFGNENETKVMYCHLVYESICCREHNLHYVTRCCTVSHGPLQTCNPFTCMIEDDNQDYHNMSSKTVNHSHLLNNT